MTSIINSLSSPVPVPIQPPINEPYSDPSNALKSLPSSHRALLTTLHVLFQPPMLLQALGLLDRGLVTRLILNANLDHPENQPSVSISREGEEEGEVWPPQAHIHLPPASSSSPLNASEKINKKGNETYIVRSSQPSRGRYASGSGPGITYTVRLEAWNCSCAAFAFAAFPASRYGSGHLPWDLSQDEDGDYGMEGKASGQEGEGRLKEWEFGGLSLDGINEMEEGGVPICKHLLACLLGKKWSDVLGGYVKEREVSREEMAGYGTE